MEKIKIPKRVTTALLNSLGAGVVPRVGLEHVAVGRKEEINAILVDLESIAEGGAAFRFIVGRYGSGKSFMLQIIRNYAMERGYVVADADLSPERRLVGVKGQGRATYRELMYHLSTKTRPDGGALAAILEKWISGIQAQVVKESGMRPNDSGFYSTVEAKIMEVISNMEGMVHGFDFATVLTTYWKGHCIGDDAMKDAALRWLRGEFSTKQEAHSFIDVRVIIDDDSWYDYVKLMATFVSSIGYKGLVIFIDEAVNLYKITHSTTRQNNYEKILTMFNDLMQGKVGNLGIYIGGTPQFMEDQRRGLYSYEALRSRLAESRFVKDGFRDTSGPMIRLQTLTHEEIFVLLKRLVDIHAAHYGYSPTIGSNELTEFMQEAVSRMGAEELLTPRDIVRDFISMLNILHQNPDTPFSQVMGSLDFKIEHNNNDENFEEDDEFAEFTL
ncbi:ATP-binding protein [Ruminiclostridium cellulolyticum]|uniref:Biotin carboxylase n=1 Tax=Ruminiclostridium cellulolyticum (strain ATCC 35319 / DSM 5812 / JCM 6584 / H10) TaxID=394503 RepID=B8I965_RUMCH|nr:ATP-binding protein [Ruminiclostridium cellulolyticum]ACL75325.1 conserved hypothetical protein [Ruminiclostridium cellulolyticum H10]